MPSQATPAAGGVVWRRADDGTVEVALVHRPRYDDWSLPKGKARPGESLLTAAVREVGEELGATVAVSRRLSPVRYHTPAGRKTVSYWAMRLVQSLGTADTEVDEIDWLDIPAARRRLTYALDRQVVAEFAAVPQADSVVVLVRHAKAGKRSEWRGNDDKRPLDFLGEQQALRLVPFLRAFAPDRVYAAEPLRCVQTVQPLADELDLAVLPRAEFGDEAFAQAPERTIAAVCELAEPGRVCVLCSQGDAIPGTVAALAPAVTAADIRKGGAWVLGFGNSTVVFADYYDDPSAPAQT